MISALTLEGGSGFTRKRKGRTDDCNITTDICHSVKSSLHAFLWPKGSTKHCSLCYSKWSWEGTRLQTPQHQPAAQAACCSLQTESFWLRKGKLSPSLTQIKIIKNLKLIYQSFLRHHIILFFLNSWGSFSRFHLNLKHCVRKPQLVNKVRINVLWPVRRRGKKANKWQKLQVCFKFWVRWEQIGFVLLTLIKIWNARHSLVYLMCFMCLYLSTPIKYALYSTLFHVALCGLSGVQKEPAIANTKSGWKSDTSSL